MKTALIAAIAQNNVIGKDNQLLWRLSEDMKLFRKLTTGHSIIMGRKTFESIGSKPLPNRTNIVVSRQLDYETEECLTATSLAEAIQMADERGEEEVFIIGGGEIYRLGLYVADILYISHVHAQPEGDTYFPVIDHQVWELKEKQLFFKNEKNEYDFDFCVYMKRK